jgi:hypothetical protein
MSLSWSSNSSPLTELLKSSSESMLPVVTGVAGKSIIGGSGDFSAFLRGSSEGLSWMFASEAFRLWAVGGVVVLVRPVPPDDGTRLPTTGGQW